MSVITVYPKEGMNMMMCDWLGSSLGMRGI